jgi:hypothetical protein
MKNLVIVTVGLLALTIGNACEQKTGFLIPAPFTQGNVGLIGADSACQNFADSSASIPPGTYRAWLSTLSQSAAGRIFSVAANDRVPIKNVAGQVIAANKGQLLDGAIDNLFLDPSGVESDGFVWTGTKDDGTADGRDCKAWGSPLSYDNGIAGGASYRNASWTDYAIPSCDNEFGLYCISIDTYTPPILP